MRKLRQKEMWWLAWGLSDLGKNPRTLALPLQPLAGAPGLGEGTFTRGQLCRGDPVITAAYLYLSLGGPSIWSGPGWLKKGALSWPWAIQREWKPGLSEQLVQLPQGGVGKEKQNLAKKICENPGSEATCNPRRWVCPVPAATGTGPFSRLVWLSFSLQSLPASQATPISNHYYLV